MEPPIQTHLEGVIGGVPLAGENRGRSVSRNPLASVRDKDAAEILLASHAEVNARDNTGGTSLHGVASLGRKDVAELLLASGAEVKARDNTGATPLYIAAKEGGHKQMTEFLSQHCGHK